jgi:hypothetical protein
MLCSIPKSAKSIACGQNRPELQSRLPSFSDLVRSVDSWEREIVLEGKFGGRRQNASRNCCIRPAIFLAESWTTHRRNREETMAF